MTANLFSKVKESLMKEGIFRTTAKIVRYPFNLIKQKQFKKAILFLPSNEERFTWIYKNNFWGSKESVSGSGSNLTCTENLRKELPGLFRMFSVSKVFDAPCGDFNWMRHLLTAVEIKYIGGDIVKPLVDRLNAKYKTDRISFIHFDLVKDIPPNADLMICRDCLFHLSYEDTRAVLKNYLRSNIPYFLTTNYKNINNLFTNNDILTGDFRLIDLFSSPYRFPAEPQLVIDDWVPPEPERQMCLWSREQIANALRDFKI